MFYLIYMKQTNLDTGSIGMICLLAITLHAGVEKNCSSMTDCGKKDEAKSLGDECVKLAPNDCQTLQSKGMSDSVHPLVAGGFYLG